MSPIAAPLLTFLFFSGFAAAQIFAPDCSLTWKWTFNSLGQNACTVAAYLMSTCNGGTFTVDALLPGYSYQGPSNTFDDSDLCKCNTVTYSLISACDACQGATWISWSEYSSNCTTILPPSSFPNPIPAGTRVPQWALLDITSENNWNSNKSLATGDTPEQAPGVLLGPSGATVSATGTRSGATSSPSGESSSTVNPTSGSSPTSKSSSNTGAIVGGVVGGVAIISLAAIAVMFFLRQRRPEAPAPVAPSVYGASQPPMDEIQQPLTMNDGYTTTSIPGTIGSSVPGTTGGTMRIYDPNDPSTFPGYQGIPQTPTSPPQGIAPSFSGYQGVPEGPPSPFQGTAPSGNSLATMQTARGYHGLPMV